MIQADSQANDLASHLSTPGKSESEDSKREESENEESESEEGDESEFEPLAKRPCNTRTGRHASSFILQAPVPEKSIKLSPD